MRGPSRPAKNGSQSGVRIRAAVSKPKATCVTFANAFATKCTSSMHSLSLASYTSLTLKKVPFENWTGLARPLARARTRAWVGIEDVPRKMPKSLGASDRFWWPARESSRELHWAQSFILRWRSSTGSLFSLSLSLSLSLSFSLSLLLYFSLTVSEK